MKNFQKSKAKETPNFQTPDWFKGKFIKKERPAIKPVSLPGTQHRG